MKKRNRGPAINRFLDKSITMPNGCWLWTGSAAGRCGSFMEDYFYWHAHRWSYTYFIGEIPDGFVVHHKCKERFCVNPYHLETMSHADHQTLHVGNKTHCKRGHEFTEENTRLGVKNDLATRQCITCCNIRSMIHRSIPENKEVARLRTRAHYWSDPELGRKKQREYHKRKTHL